MIKTQKHESQGIASPLTQGMVYTADKYDDQSNVELLVGQAALQALDDAFFTAQWEQLSNRCNWGTVFQSKAFVATWYKLYQNQFLPIILRSYHNGMLTGLLTVTKKNSGNTILVAGARAAHYQVWLADQDQGEAFIKTAIIALRRKFTNHEINFYNTPPQTPLDWALQDPVWQLHCSIRAFRRPLMNLRDPNIMEVINSRRSRKRINQLKKLGKVEFEHVTSLMRYTEVLDILSEQYDFRKAAKYNWTEFRSDPIKKDFLQQLFKEGLLHVTLLTLNGEIIGSITDTLGYNKWVHGTEISTHSCVHAKHSPGIINFLLLGQHLAEKGYCMYDLTPGSDPYKARLSNAHDYVHGLYITGMFKAYINRNITEPIRLKIRNILNHYNINPKLIKDQIRKYMYSAFTTKHATLLLKMVSTNALISKSKIYLIPVTPIETEAFANIKRDSLSDLLDYDQSNNYKGRWDFLSDAMRRLEAGERPYTLSQNGLLMLCCWSTVQQTATQNNGAYHETIILQGFYTHSKAANLLVEFVGNVAKHIKSAHPSYSVCITNDNAETRRQIK